MPKSVNRVTVTRTHTYTTTIDVPGYADIQSNADLLTILGGAAGTTGTLAIGDLLSGSIANNGSISRGSWSVSGSVTRVEPYITRPRNTRLELGQRVISVSPPAGFEAAIGMVFVVTAVAGDQKTADTSTEPNWPLTAGSATVVDGNVTFRAFSKFVSIANYAVGAQTAGAVVRPGTGSLKEYLVITAGTSTGTPSWATGTNDTIGTQISLPTAGVVVCIAGAKLYAPLTVYNLGDVIKRVDANTEEYLVITAGRSDGTATGSVSWPALNSTGTIGTATIRRVL